MRRTLALAGVVLVATASCSTPAATAAPAPASTAPVKKGKLSATVSLDGVLTYRNTYAAINHAAGTYTSLPDGGDRIGCGDTFYRVDDRPVLLLCGPVPGYRDLRSGDTGNDVRELNDNLRRLGYPAGAGNGFTGQTRDGLEKLQHARGAAVTGELHRDDTVVLPGAVRIAKVVGVLGAAAPPGAAVVQATSDTLEVQVSLDALQQGSVKQGAKARITLPSNASVTGRVDRVGRVVQASGVPAYLTLDDPAQASGLDQAPVQVDITTAGVNDALNVPVTALVGKAGGGFAVEVVRNGGAHELVAVQLGLYDSTAGQVQVSGALHEGDAVVVPSS